MMNCGKDFSMTFNFSNPLLREHLYSGSFGLERETLRVDRKGRLSQIAHPFGDEAHISRDFCENQVEIITPPTDSPHNAVESLHALHRKAAAKLLSLPTGQEVLWPFSNPPFITGEDEIPIADFRGGQSEKTVYREYLARKYGKKKMLFCGIHCNFSFHESLLQAGFEESGMKTFRAYKDAVYLTLAQRLLEYGWLIVWLTAASPVSDPSLFEKGIDGSRYASPRCGDVGYWNDFVPVLNYASIEQYTESIWRYIKEGSIVSPSELYYPIRLKPKGENRLDHLRLNGVNHIELRMLDVNPLTSVGIFEEDIAFIQLLILWLMSLEGSELDEESQKNAVNNIKNAALYDEERIFIENNGEKTPIREAAAKVLRDMRDLFLSVDAQEEVFALLDYQQKKTEDAHNRYAVKIREQYGENYTAKGLALAKKYAEAD